MSADTHTEQEAAELTVGDPFLWYAAAARFAAGLGGRRYVEISVHGVPPDVFERAALDSVRLVQKDGAQWIFGRRVFGGDELGVGEVTVNLYSTHATNEITETYARLVAAGKAES